MDTNKPEPKIIHRKRRFSPKSDTGARIRQMDQRPGLTKFTLDIIYKNLYILGIVLLRRKNKMMRGILKFFNRFRGSSYALLEKLTAGVVNFWHQLIKNIKAPFIRLGNIRRQMRPVVEKSKRDGKSPLWAYGQVGYTLFRLLFTIFRTLFNYAVPVAAAIVLVIVVRDRLDVEHSVGLAVTYNDQHIGLIQHETVFEEATRIIKGRFISEEDIPIVLTPQFALRELEDYESFMEPRDLANMIVAASGGEIDDGFGLYVDNIFLGAYGEIEPIIDELNYILDSYRTGIEGEQVAFVRSIRVDDGVFPTSSMRSIEQIRDQLNMDDPYAPLTSYIAREDDTIATVANRLGISYDRLVEINPVLEYRDVTPGQILNVPISQPFMPVMNIRTIVFPEEFPFDVYEIETIQYVRGFRSIATAGQPGVREVTASVSEVNGVEINREILSTRILSAPVTQRVIVGTNHPSNIVSFGSVSSQGFLWPTRGGRITVGLHGYPGHTGVDIPRPAGYPIFAAASGTVVRVVHSGVGYGRHVIIDHHNGYTTLYAHASAIHVTVGQRVNQGDVIASIGRTGNATGNHLHFEVRRHGRIMNPAHYISP